MKQYENLKLRFIKFIQGKKHQNTVNSRKKGVREALQSEYDISSSSAENNIYVIIIM